jgi:predicted alpha-1,6-mannanase (GH76 family)
MMNERGTFNDGLTQDCVNNNKTVWSYNQGVILRGLMDLSYVTNDPEEGREYMDAASDIALAALRELSDEAGVIHDVCEPDCGIDGAQAKGIFMRNFALLYDEMEIEMLYDEAERPLYDMIREALLKIANSIWANRWDVDFGGANGTGVVFMLSDNWAGPFRGSVAGHSSAMDALVAPLSIPE